MAGTRKPGPLGLNCEVESIDEGTLSRCASPLPGPTGLSPFPGKSISHKPISHSQRTHAPISLNLRSGDRGANVRALQTLLNLRLDPSPQLRVDGYFGPNTVRAVHRFQTVSHIQADGVAGKLTWYHLVSVRTTKPLAANSVVGWSLTKKVEEVVRRLPSKLPSEVLGQMRSLMSTDSLVIFVALFATSQLFGVGELIGAGILLILGEQVVFDLLHTVQITALATTESELDEAAGYLANAIVTVGVAAFAAALAKFIRGGKAQTTESRTASLESGSTSGARPPTAASTTRTPPLAIPDETPPVEGELRAVRPNAVEKTVSDLNKMYKKAPAAKEEIDALSDQVANQVGGKVAKAPLKSPQRALQKALEDYGGDASRVKDLARNTIVVPKGSEQDALAALLKANPEIDPKTVKIIDGATDKLGYSGVNVTVPTKVGIPAEIQINTPEMIYAKENPAAARSILGDDLYDQIASRPDLPPGGLGHQFYEQWRSLPPGSPEADQIAKQSRAYYEAFRR